MFKKKLKITMPEVTERAVLSTASDYQAIIGLLYDNDTLKAWGTISKMKNAEKAWSELLKVQCALQIIVFSQLRPDIYEALRKDFFAVLEAQLSYNPDNKFTGYLKKDIVRPTWQKDMMAYFNLVVPEIGSHVAKNILSKLPQKADSTQQEILEIFLRHRYKANHEGLSTFTYSFL